ncbi:hypothetical protein LCGC14_1022690 [marine sediment metagenome]|uniref:Uncharacterized protein n=1 Tax=marine sediment metagenome TaxID=412755 RepID=A0A0F9QF48_9ZZZZ
MRLAIALALALGSISAGVFGASWVVDTYGPNSSNPNSGAPHLATGTLLAGFVGAVVIVGIYALLEKRL